MGWALRVPGGYVIWVHFTGIGSLLSSRDFRALRNHFPL